ncbi:hypothetical protein GCM10022220_33120 [Actinocatenispora rupis]|uniref:EcsC protein family protein n=1 Tax=Actinocatenispora rupis TaxID=519421 RepID=A0A8J3JA04_9ACTN|nr:hypothetical protein Aru02nite_37110 [Actinocatenispora rupis]
MAKRTKGADHAAPDPSVPPEGGAAGRDPASVPGTGPVGDPADPVDDGPADVIDGEVLSGELLSRDGGPVASDDLSRTVARLTEETLEPAERRRLLGRLAGQAGRTGWRLMSRPRGVLRWITDAVMDAAPHIPIRDLETLRRHYHGLDGDALAERLIRNASRVTATIGAAGGGLSAIEWATPPTLLTAPVLLSAETVAVVAVEIKLLGELHEVYRMPVRGNATQRAAALVSSWAGRRGVSLTTAGRGLTASLGLAARRELRDKLLRRFGRNLTTLGPLLTGAAVGAELNRRATRAVGQEIRADLARIARQQLRQPPPGMPVPPPQQPYPGGVPYPGPPPYPPQQPPPGQPYPPSGRPGPYPPQGPYPPPPGPYPGPPRRGR